MLLEIFTTIIDDIKTEIPAVKHAAYYKDELRSDNWNPKYPVVFARYDGTKPVNDTKLADGSYAKSKILVSLFAGDKDTASPLTLNLVEKLEHLFNANELSIVVNDITYRFPVYLTTTGTDFVSYIKGLSVYRVQIEIEVPTGLLPVSSGSLPDAPVLLSPANGAIDVDTAHPALVWDGAEDDLDYTILVSDDALFTNIVYQQTNHLYLNTVIPDDIIEPGTVYYWKVRARNATGYGVYSAAFSFTTSESGGILPITMLQAGLNDVWLRGDDLTLASGAVASANDKSGNGRHFTNSTIANRPITEIINGRTFIKFDGTLTDVRNLSFNDITHIFKSTGSEVRTFAFIIKIGNNTTGRANAIIARSNNNVGDEFYFRLPTAGGGSLTVNYFGFPKSNGAWDDIVMPNNPGTVHLVILEVNQNICKIFIDGVLIAVNTVTFPNVSLPANASTFLVLGGTRQSNATQGTFNGSIAEFASGAKILTANEIAGLWLQVKEYYTL